MARFTKELRQQIVREFAVRHNGQYDAGLFLREVEESGPEHPAHSWFEWDGERAAQQHRLSQARDFASDLRVTFTVEEVGRDKAITVTKREAPMVISPMADRSTGGGYHLTDPGNPSHMAELCRQGAAALAAWLRRYESAVEHAGGSVESLRKQVKKLESASSSGEADAA